jgi:hypothetical protein
MIGDVNTDNTGYNDIRYHNLIAKRTVYVSKLLKEGLTVLIFDVDAVWLKVITFLNFFLPRLPGPIPLFGEVPRYGHCWAG